LDVCFCYHVFAKRTVLRGYAGDTVDEAGYLVALGEGFGDRGTDGDDLAGVVAADCCVVLREVV